MSILWSNWPHHCSVLPRLESVQSPNSYQQPQQAYPQNPHAYYSSPALPTEENWYPDTGTTHHVTSEHQHLNLSSEDYTSQDKIRVGDGSGLPITHIGSALLTLTRRRYILTQLLLVPLICKNLLSVQKFSRDNAIFFEFHPSYFVIKDCKSKITLHQGPFKDGLYQLHPSSTFSINKQALVGERTSSNHWHKRLGHPALRTVHQVLFMFQLLVINNKATSPCTACP